MARRSSAGGPIAGLVAVLLVIGLVLLVIKWLLITAAILVVPFGIWWFADRRRTGGARTAHRERAEALARRRRDVESRAVVDAGGGCGWCGSRVAHRDFRSGSVVLPRDHHRAEIEDAVRGRFSDR